MTTRNWTHVCWTWRGLALGLLLLLAAGIASAQVTTLVQISDVHLGRSLFYEPPDKGPWARAVREIIADCNDIIKPAAVVATGDLVSAPGDADFADYRDTVSGLQAPLLNCPGNHDLTGAGASDLFARDIGPLHQARLVDGVYLACLNTASLLGATDPTAELAWLSDALATPEAQGARLRIVCGHYPLYEDESRATGGAFTREGFQILGATREAFMHVLRVGKADLYLSGHVHSTWDEVCLVSGTRQLVTDATCGSVYRVIVVDGQHLGTRTTGVHGWPLVVVTAPTQYVVGSSVRTRGTVAVRAKVFSPSVVQEVTCALEGGAALPMTLTSDGMYEAQTDLSKMPVGLRKLVVTAKTADGRVAEMKMQFVVCR